jgi:hypothetical protein
MRLSRSSWPSDGGHRKRRRNEDGKECKQTSAALNSCLVVSRGKGGRGAERTPREFVSMTVFKQQAPHVSHCVLRLCVSATRTGAELGDGAEVSHSLCPKRTQQPPPAGGRRGTSPVCPRPTQWWPFLLCFSAAAALAFALVANTTP